jgi:uncharacterized BrkB/YihY/UPF0761 family membrane protein
MPQPPDDDPVEPRPVAPQKGHLYVLALAAISPLITALLVRLTVYAMIAQVLNRANLPSLEHQFVPLHNAATIPGIFVARCVCRVPSWCRLPKR